VTEPTVWTFFYGSYINLDVLRAVDLVPAQVDVARLGGYDIRIEPLANLVPSTKDSVYGILAPATHRQLHRLYTEHAQGVLGGVYEPHAVLAETLDGRWRAALCYISHTLTPARPDPAYVGRIVGPARTLGFPDWYVARLESFAEFA
jgi:hypothetical protein